MSTPVITSESAAAESARQHLDELDALLERMLAIPVYQPDGEDPVADPLPPSNAETIEADSTAEPHHADQTQEPIAAAPEPPTVIATTRLEETSSTDVQPAMPADGVLESVPVPAAAGPPAENAGVVDSPLTVSTATDPQQPIPKPRVVIPFSYWPLVLINGAFDRCLAPVGGPGRWLQGENGRAALGTTGLLLLAGALVWGILDWLVWNW